METIENMFGCYINEESENFGKQKKVVKSQTEKHSNSPPPPQLPCNKSNEFKSNKYDDSLKNDDECIKHNTNIILDPLSVIIKLAIICNKSNGTKILIKDGIVHIQEPGLFQGITRYINKTNRYDLQYLYNPIFFACKYFLNKEARKKNPEMVDLFICAQNGISRLIETYKGNTIIRICLNYCFVILDNYIKEIYNPIFRDDDITKLYTNEILSKLNEIWTPEKMKIVLDMIHFLNDDKSADENVKSLDIFIQNIDKRMRNI